MYKWSLVIICGSLLTVVVGVPGFHNSVGMKTFRRDVLPNSKHIFGRPLQIKDTKYDVEILKLDVIELPYKWSRDSLNMHHNYGRLPALTLQPASYHQQPAYHQQPSYHQAPPYHQGSSHDYRRSPHHHVTHKEKQTYRRDEELNYSKYISGRKPQTQNRKIDIEIIKLDVIELPYKHPQTSPQYDPQIVRHFYYAQLPSQPLSPPPYHEHSHHYRGSPYHHEDKPISSDHKDQYLYKKPETAFYDKQHPPLSHSKAPPSPLNHRTLVFPPQHQTPSKISNSNENQPKTMDSMLEENSTSVTTTTEQEFMIDIRSGDK